MHDAPAYCVPTKFGGGGMYNEMIEFIRFFFLGSQVRGEYYCSGQKRICRTRTKTFELKSLTLALEIEISDLTSNAVIFEAVLAYFTDRFRLSIA